MFAITERMIDIAAQNIHDVACGGEPWDDARIADREQHRNEARSALHGLAVETDFRAGEPEWSETLHNDGTYEYTATADCDGSNVQYLRRTPDRIIHGTPWEKIDADTAPNELKSLL